MRRVLRVGLLGCGAITRSAHLPSLRRLDGVVIAALADSSPEALSLCARMAPRAALYSDAQQLLESEDVDAVIVATPSGIHAEHGLDVLAATKHLYLEKPIATTSVDAERLCRAARETTVVSAVGFNRRFHPAIACARAALARDDIGSIVEARTVHRWRAPLETRPAWKRRRDEGGGALLDLASHHIDLLRFLLGTEVERASAVIHSHESEDDEGSLSLELSGGIVAKVDVGFSGPNRDLIELRGTNGELRIDRHSGLRVRLWRGYDPSYVRALAAFVAAIRGEEIPELATIEDGRRSLEAILLCEGSR
jgi:predicted dehydrogenase